MAGHQKCLERYLVCDGKNGIQSLEADEGTTGSLALQSPHLRLALTEMLWRPLRMTSAHPSRPTLPMESLPTGACQSVLLEL